MLRIGKSTSGSWLTPRRFMQIAPKMISAAMRIQAKTERRMEIEMRFKGGSVQGWAEGPILPDIRFSSQGGRSTGSRGFAEDREVPRSEIASRERSAAEKHPVQLGQPEIGRRR